MGGRRKSLKRVNEKLELLKLSLNFKNFIKVIHLKLKKSCELVIKFYANFLALIEEEGRLMNASLLYILTNVYSYI